MLARKAHIKSLDVLDRANQGDEFVTDQVQLVGVPKGETYEQFPNRFDTYQKLLTEFDCDLIFLQVDPSAYMAR